MPYKIPLSEESSADVNGKVVATRDVHVAANETTRVVFDDLPKDSYGTIVLNSDVAGVYMQNLTRRGSDYVLTYAGQ